MNNKQLMSLFGLKWNPFGPEIPKEGLLSTDKIDRFVWEVENLVLDGGFGMVTGDPGTGKSVALRILSGKLEGMRDLSVGVLERPQSNIADFYRELGNLFGIELRGANRFSSFRMLRQKWHHHIESNLLRPVLLIDESQEMPISTLNELRLMSSTDFDSRIILTIVLCGDRRLPEKFRIPDLLPLGSRIRTRLVMQPQSKTDLVEFLKEAISKAGNPGLMTDSLIKTLAEHSAGNYRALCVIADQLLKEGVRQQAKQLTEKLFFDYTTEQRPVRKQRKEAVI